MHRTVNMLSAKKVKLHGMATTKWTTKDKTVQYRAMVKLYERDQKIMKADGIVAKKRLQRELKALQKNIENDRRKLDNAIRGNKQELRNILSESRDLQLAHQRSQPEKVIENIQHINFITRKMLDKVKYEKKLKSQELIDLKLEQALLEDRLKYPSLDQIQQEKDAQIITGKVQDATLKHEAALALRHIYNEIYDIMKKDSLYFESILNTIQYDGVCQSTCILNAIKLGQLATEYLDDRRNEYNKLEKAIAIDLQARKTDLKLIQEKVSVMAAEITQLLRKDSDVTTCYVHVADVADMEQLSKELDRLEWTLNYLKSATLVPSFEAIFPCLNQQVEQRQKLKQFAKKCGHARDTLMNKLNHAELMSNVLKNTVTDATIQYKNRKDELNKMITEIIRINTTNEKLLHTKHSHIANIRIAFAQFHQLSQQIAINPIKMSKSAKLNVGKLKAPKVSVDDVSGLQILPEVINRITQLMANYQKKLEDSRLVEAHKTFETMMHERCLLATDNVDKFAVDSSSLDEIFTETSNNCPTRDDIKKQSEEIVAANTRNDDLIPVFTTTKPKKILEKSK